MNIAYNLPPGYPIPVSSLTGLGKKDIWKVIKAAMLGELFVEDDNKVGDDNEIDSDEDEDDDDSANDDPLVKLLRDD